MLYKNYPYQNLIYFLIYFWHLHFLSYEPQHRFSLFVFAIFTSHQAKKDMDTLQPILK